MRTSSIVFIRRKPPQRFDLMNINLNSSCPKCNILSIYFLLFYFLFPKYWMHSAAVTALEQPIDQRARIVPSMRYLRNLSIVGPIRLIVWVTKLWALIVVHIISHVMLCCFKIGYISIFYSPCILVIPGCHKVASSFLLRKLRGCQW